MNDGKQPSPVRQLIRFSNYSLCITLPKEFTESLNWKQGDQITFKLDKEHRALLLSKSDQQVEKILPPTLSSKAPPPKDQPPPRNQLTAPRQPLILPKPSSHDLDDLQPIPQL